MKLLYLPVHFYINFTNPVKIDTYPVFVLRSMLGKNLRRMCCISHSSECTSCIYNKTCAYVFIFETILPQNNKICYGINRASHPFAFTQNSNLNKVGGSITFYDFTITLFGKAIEYLPYIYAAFVKTGEGGIFKSRTQFIVKKVMIGDENILDNSEMIKTDVCPLVWEFDNFDFSEKELKQSNYLIELKSPLRFKTQGKYTKDFDADSFVLCLFRRMKTLCKLYGDGNIVESYSINPDLLEIQQRDLRWFDLAHYSSRQKKAMELGGVIGSFKLCGTFSPFDIALLDFAKNVNAGKNTNFGLGQMTFWKEC